MVASDRPAQLMRGIDPFMATLAIALGLHLALLGWRVGPSRSGLAPDIADITFDIDLSEQVAVEEEAPLGLAAPSDTVAATRAPLPAGAKATPVDEAAAVGDHAELATSIADAQQAPVAAADQPGSLPETSRPRVRLFLGAQDLKALVGPAEQGPSKSAALFSEGSTGEVGASVSSPAISAGYRSAQLGPRVGTAVFEVRTSAAGAVTAVYLLSDDDSGAWAGVTQDLLRRLGASLLRVPEGAKGVVTRLRIDRGYLAKDLSERGKVQKGTALGQDHHPKDLGWDESTQGSTRPNRLAPSAGVSSEMLNQNVPTRVVLLSQQFL